MTQHLPLNKNFRSFFDDPPPDDIFNRPDFFGSTNGTLPGLPSGDNQGIGPIIEEAKGEALGVVDTSQGILGDLRGLIGDERSRVETDFPINPFTDKQRQSEQETLFDIINDQANSLALQNATNLNVRGIRGGGGISLQDFGNIQRGRFESQTQSFNQLGREQREFNQRALETREGILGKLTGFETLVGGQQAFIELERIGIISGAAEGEIAQINIEKIEKLFEDFTNDVESESNKDAENALFDFFFKNADNIVAFLPLLRGL